MADQGQVLEQWCKGILDFSSQYGSETNISYTVSNIVGPNKLFPTYGDFTQAAVLRTYGPWWQEAPSAAEPFQRTPPSFISQDFIDMAFETKVYPTALQVFEIYNPGCVVKVLAADTSQKAAGHIRWYTLWSGQPQTNVRAEARRFSPKLYPCPFPTNVLRLEFNSCHVEYYTELDAVLLCGTTHPPPNFSLELNPLLLPDSEAGGMDDDDDNPLGTNVDTGLPDCDTCVCDMKDCDCNTVVASLSSRGSTSCCCVRRPIATPSSKVLPPATALASPTTPLTSPTDKITQDMAALHMQDNDDGLSAALDSQDNGCFETCPEEVIQLILSFLDLQSLCRLASVSRLFYKHCYDPLQSTELNLQPYWTKVTDSTLGSLTQRSRHLHRINLSWCGNYNSITEKPLISYLCVIGPNLTCLRLACCHLVNNSIMEAIALNCKHIQELDIQCNKKIDMQGFVYLRELTTLRKLNLYRTHIDVTSLTNMIRVCPDLEHLNIGSCTAVNNFDDIAFALGTYCKRLRCLDVWRGRTLSDVGLSCLAANCTQLEELDAGWCVELRSNTGCFEELARQCRGLKKIYLTANRTVSDRDLCALADYCPLLEQLDILGTREVSKAAAYKILEQCKHLRFFDVSFCAGITLIDVDFWRKRYQHVSIKRSFQGS